MPASASAGEAKERVEVVAPNTGKVVFLNHWNVGAGEPVTTAVNDAGEPAATVREIGCVVMVGAALVEPETVTV